jgi:hypothetical protein
MRHIHLLVCVGLSYLMLALTGCAEADSVDAEPTNNQTTIDSDSGTPDAGIRDAAVSDDAGSRDMGSDDASTSDMSGALLPPGPTRFAPAASGAQRLGSERHRLGVTVGTPGSPLLESEEYRLRVGPQPYLVRPGARAPESEQ